MENNRYYQLVKEYNISKEDTERKAMIYVISQNDILYQDRDKIYNSKERCPSSDLDLDCYSNGIARLLRMGLSHFNFSHYTEEANFRFFDDANFKIAINSILIQRMNDAFLNLKELK